MKPGKMNEKFNTKEKLNKKTFDFAKTYVKLLEMRQPNLKQWKAPSVNIVKQKKVIKTTAKGLSHPESIRKKLWVTFHEF